MAPKTPHPLRERSTTLREFIFLKCVLVIFCLHASM